jgi:Subtilase family
MNLKVSTGQLRSSEAPDATRFDGIFSKHLETIKPKIRVGTTTGGKTGFVNNTDRRLPIAVGGGQKTTNPTSVATTPSKIFPGGVVPPVGIEEYSAKTLGVTQESLDAMILEVRKGNEFRQAVQSLHSQGITGSGQKVLVVDNLKGGGDHMARDAATAKAVAPGAQIFIWDNGKLAGIEFKDSVLPMRSSTPLLQHVKLQLISNMEVMTAIVAEAKRAGINTITCSTGSSFYNLIPWAKSLPTYFNFNDPKVKAEAKRIWGVDVPGQLPRAEFVSRLIRYVDNFIKKDADVISAVNTAKAAINNYPGKIFVASGNDGDKGIPAAWQAVALVRHLPESVVGVGATDPMGTVAKYSSRGGVAFTQEAAYADYGLYSRLAFWRGTSFAAPYAAGVYALMGQVAPNLTPSQKIAIMQDTANNTNAPRDLGGAGDLNVKNAIKAAMVRARRLQP